MSRTFKKRINRALVGAVRPKEEKPYEGGYTGRRARGTLCCLCDNFAIQEIPNGLGYESPVCDNPTCLQDLKQIARRNREKREKEMNG